MRAIWYLNVDAAPHPLPDLLPVKNGEKFALAGDFADLQRRKLSAEAAASGLLPVLTGEGAGG